MLDGVIFTYRWGWAPSLGRVRVQQRLHSMWEQYVTFQLQVVRIIRNHAPNEGSNDRSKSKRRSKKDCVLM